MNTDFRSSIKKNLNIILLIAVYCLFVVILQFLTGGVFLKARNISNLLRSMAFTTVLASGIFFVILTGGIDLSVGWLMGLLGAVSATLMVRFGANTVVAILVSLGIGIAAGALHGFLVAQAKVPAFIATLGAYMVYKGVLIRVTGGATIAGLNADYNFFGQAYLPPVLSWILGGAVVIVYLISLLSNRRARAKYGLPNSKLYAMMIKFAAVVVLVALFIAYLNSYQGVPVPVVVMLLFVGAATFVAQKTPYGRAMYAIGGNANAAKYAGINVKRNMWIAFIISGFTAACASVIYTARLGAASTQAGNMAEMDAIAATVIGGTSLSGGVGNPPLILLGALFMMTIDNGMTLLNISSEYQYVVKGIVLVLAVAVDSASNKKRLKG